MAGESSTRAPTGPATNIYLSVGVGGAPRLGAMATGSLFVDVASFVVAARTSKAPLAIWGVPDVSIQDYSALVGKVWRNPHARFYVTAGLGMATVVRRQDPTPGWTPQIERDHVVNLPLEAGASGDGAFAGLGLAVIGNLNRVQSDVGVVLTVSLGKLRD